MGGPIRSIGARRLAFAVLLVSGVLAPLSGGGALRFPHPNPAAVTRYRVHAGTDSRAYRWSYLVGAVAGSPQQVLTIPFETSPGLPLYVALTAIDAAGRESALSNEIVVTTPGTRGPDDGVADDGNGSGVVGDLSCQTGQTRACDDNCPLLPNGPLAGTCLEGDADRLSRGCLDDVDCGALGFCSLDQEDGDRDGVGDACDGVAAACPIASADTDGDGVGNECDTCLVVANAIQVDSDRDGYGNACDFDYNGDGRVDRLDSTIMNRSFGQRRGRPRTRYQALLDADGDGYIGPRDRTLLRLATGRPLGPSGLACAGQAGCSPP